MSSKQLKTRKEFIPKPTPKMKIQFVPHPKPHHLIHHRQRPMSHKVLRTGYTDYNQRVPPKTLRSQTPNLYKRTDSFTQRAKDRKSIDNEYQIIYERASLLLPSNSKEKQLAIFEQKCNELLSRKKSPSPIKKDSPQKLHNAKLQETFGSACPLKIQPIIVGQKCRKESGLLNQTEMIETFERHQVDDKQEFERLIQAQRKKKQLNQFVNKKLGVYQKPVQVSRGFDFEVTEIGPQSKLCYQPNQLTDKLQILGLIRSAELKKTQQEGNKTQIQSPLSKNKLIKKTHVMLIDGMSCFSLSLNQIPTKRSLIKPNRPPVRSASSCRRVILSRAGSQKTMKFQANQDSDASYMKRLKSYFDFLFKINYSNQIYVSLNLGDDHNMSDSKDSDVQLFSPLSLPIFRYKVYVGPGNNNLLVKSLLQRRFWIQIVSKRDQKNISFYWTQNKIDQLHNRQKCKRSKEKSLICFATESDEKRNARSPKQRLRENQRQKIELNRKILPESKCRKIESYISPNGYSIPFEEQYYTSLVTNHLPNNSMVGSKKKLFKSMFRYYTRIKKDPFDYVPKTYHVKGRDDPEFKRFMWENKQQPDKVWIVKPGQNSNQGKGIKLAPTRHVTPLIKGKSKHSNGQPLTFIIQSYIEAPFLYHGRKFDIRHYMMLTSVNGIMKAYWYKDGYIRTSSEAYDVEDLDNQFIHLTNDYIQRYSDYYQRYEAGNKVSYFDFQKYLDFTHSGKGYNFQRDIVLQMKAIITDVVRANFRAIDYQRNQCNFQIFGFDFMVDKNFKPWLIEINFNPCLEISCPLLNRIIPQMIQCSLRIGFDPLFPPKNHFPISKRFNLSDNYLKNLRYQLIFDQSNLKSPSEFTTEDIKQLEGDEQQDQYPDEGKQVQDFFL